MANCSIPIHVSEDLVKQFQDFQRGKTEHKYLSFRLAGKDLSTLELAESGASDCTHDQMVERTCVAEEPRFTFFQFAYDLGEDGRRVKTVLLSWVPPKSPVRAKMLAAASRSVAKKALGFGFGIEVHASDKGEASEESCLAKCMSVTR
jgi:cofilin